MPISKVGTAIGNIAAQICDTATAVTAQVDDLVVLVSTINQTTGANTFTSHGLGTGSTATLGTVTTILNGIGSASGEVSLSVSWAKVTGAGDVVGRTTSSSTRTQATLMIVLRGQHASAPVGTPNSSSGLAGQPASGTVTPGAAGDWFLGFGSYEEVSGPGLGAPTPTATPSAWTGEAHASAGTGANFIRGYIESFIATDTTAYESAPTLSAATDWAQGVVVIAAAAGGGGSAPIPVFMHIYRQQRA